MNTKNMTKLAKLHCIFDSALTRAALIRSIHVADGNPDCFANAGRDECVQPQCFWREDCMSGLAICSNADAGPAVLAFSSAH